MIGGMGIDIVSIDFISSMLVKNKTIFLEQNFSAQEISLCQANKKKAAHSFAGKFAAKEAFLKAVPKFKKFPFSFSEIEIWNDLAGKPFVYLADEISGYLKISSDIDIHLSISHHRDYAVAVVLLEQVA